MTTKEFNEKYNIPPCPTCGGFPKVEDAIDFPGDDCRCYHVFCECGKCSADYVCEECTVDLYIADVLSD